MMTYFSDREAGPQVAVTEDINQTVWGAVLSLIETRVNDGSLAHGFPSHCPDGNAIEGTDINAMWNAIRAEIRDIVTEDTESWHLFCSRYQPTDSPPDTLAILDLIEFVSRNIAQSVHCDWHSFYKHHHLSLNRQEGLEKFVEDINRIFSRNGLAYQLTDNGLIKRTLPPQIGTLLKRTVFSTGDQNLDKLLDTAIERFRLPKPESRQDALEKLWDAFERLKTIEFPKDKKESANLLITNAISDDFPVFRSAVTEEFKALTDLGNMLWIRHSEQDKEPVGDNGAKDYLFMRLFLLIWLVLKGTGRLSESQSGDLDD